MRVAILFVLFLSSFSWAAAQTPSADFLNNSEGIVFSPEYPEPQSAVKATLNNYNSLYSGATIQWYINGELAPGTDNHREIEFVVGKAGQKIEVEAVLTPLVGPTKSLFKTITPIYIDIVFEAQTHTPFFYEGRGLPSIGSLINATALIDSGSLLKEDLVYRWRVNQTVLEGGVIRGRNKVSFEMPRGSRSTVYLQVSRPSGDIIATRAIILPSVSPNVRFYEESALYGPLKHSISNDFFFTNSSLTLLAEPYNLDSRVFNNPDVVEWSINNVDSTDSAGNPYRMVIQKTGGGGQSTIGFHVRSLSEILQGAKGGVRVKY